MPSLSFLDIYVRDRTKRRLVHIDIFLSHMTRCSNRIYHMLMKHKKHPCVPSWSEMLRKYGTFHRSTRSDSFLLPDLIGFRAGDGYLLPKVWLSIVRRPDLSRKRSREVRSWCGGMSSKMEVAKPPDTPSSQSMVSPSSSTPGSTQDPFNFANRRPWTPEVGGGGKVAIFGAT